MSIDAVDFRQLSRYAGGNVRNVRVATFRPPVEEHRRAGESRANERCIMNGSQRSLAILGSVVGVAAVAFLVAATMGSSAAGSGETVPGAALGVTGGCCGKPVAAQAACPETTPGVVSAGTCPMSAAAAETAARSCGENVTVAVPACAGTTSACSYKTSTGACDDKAATCSASVKAEMTAVASYAGAGDKTQPTTPSSTPSSSETAVTVEVPKTCCGAATVR